MQWQGTSIGHVGIPLLSGKSLDFELLSKEELSVKGRLAQRSKCYPSQSAKALLKGFEINPCTVFDAGHTTVSLSANEMLQFARAIALEVTLPSYGLLEDLLSRGRESGPIDSFESPEGHVILL